MKAIAITTIIITSQGVGSKGGLARLGKNSSYLLMLTLQLKQSIQLPRLNVYLNLKDIVLSQSNIQQILGGGPKGRHPNHYLL